VIASRGSGYWLWRSGATNPGDGLISMRRHGDDQG
jgi:hypothetical protein